MKLFQITIYIIWSSKFPELISEYIFIQRYMIKDLQLSKRGVFCNFLNVCLTSMLDSPVSDSSVEFEVSLSELENLDFKMKNIEKWMP